MNISDSVIFSTCISIAVFILGFIIKERIQINSNNIKLKNSEGYLKWCLAELINSISNQVKTLKPTLKTENNKLNFFYINPSLRPENILEREETLYKIIFERKKGLISERDNAFNLIINSCKEIKEVLIELNVMFSKMDERIYSHCLKIDQVGHEIFLKINEIELKHNKTAGESKIMSFYDSIVSTNRKGLYENIVILEKMILAEKSEELLPVLNLTSNYIKEYLQYEFSLISFNSKIITHRDHLNIVKNKMSLGFKTFNKLIFKNNWIK